MWNLLISVFGLLLLIGIVADLFIIGQKSNESAICNT